jgi:uncharacterized membrane protein
MSPSEAFSRGFYGGFGLWCSFMVINIIFAAVVIALLVSMGFIGAAATVPMGKPRSAYSQPAERSDDTPSRSGRSGNR